MIDVSKYSNAEKLLRRLVGKTIYTIHQRRPNSILDVVDGACLVATERSPKGHNVPIADVQAALDQLLHDRSIEVSVGVVGYRSAFIGAVLATLPDVTVGAWPRVVRLGSQWPRSGSGVRS